MLCTTQVRTPLICFKMKFIISANKKKGICLYLELTTITLLASLCRRAANRRSRTGVRSLLVLSTQSANTVKFVLGHAKSNRSCFKPFECLDLA